MEVPWPLLAAREMEEPPPMSAAAMEESPSPLLSARGMEETAPMAAAATKHEVVVHAEDGFNLGHEDDEVVLLPAVGDHGPEGEKKAQVQQSSSLIIMFLHGCSSIVHIF
jgi:hypothetical protein